MPELQPDLLGFGFLGQPNPAAGRRRVRAAPSSHHQLTDCMHGERLATRSAEDRSEEGSGGRGPYRASVRRHLSPMMSQVTELRAGVELSKVPQDHTHSGRRRTRRGPKRIADDRRQFVRAARCRRRRRTGSAAVCFESRGDDGLKFGGPEPTPGRALTRLPASVPAALGFLR